MPEKHANPYKLSIKIHHEWRKWVAAVAAGGQNARDLKAAVRHG